jgi:cobalamin biosynthesis protein CobW
VETAMNTRIPVLVVSGFLGAGKTTLVSHLLQQAQAEGARMAVISNEFGALGIDQALLGQGGEAYVELEGGCVCCQLSDELRDTLQMLWERIRPDRIGIETSGLALPFDTQLQAWREPICRWVDDDMAVVVVNAEQLFEGRDLEGTFEDQVSSADLLLLNKIDLVPPESLDRPESILHSMAPDTPVVRSIQGQVDPSVLFPPDLRALRAQPRTAAAQPIPHRHESFLAYELPVEGGIDPGALVERLRDLGLLRSKGFVCTSHGLRLVQGVGRRIELLEPKFTPPAALVGRIVVIARNRGADNANRTVTDCWRVASVTEHRPQASELAEAGRGRRDLRGGAAVPFIGIRESPWLSGGMPVELCCREHGCGVPLVERYLVSDPRPGVPPGI